MNRRIWELAEQAVIKINNPSLDSDGKVVCDNWEEQVSLEQFAQLIIQDCIDIISPYAFRMSRPGEEYFNPIQEIKKNFGVL